MTQKRRRVPGQQKKREPEKTPPKREEEDVVYSPAKPFHRKKLMLQLLTVVAVAVAACVGLSIFFKVDTVSISGLEKYGYDTVAQASEIRQGDSLLFFSRAEVSSKILQSLPYVKSVRVGITLPGTVNIVIEEVQITYSMQDVIGQWWYISADGTVLEKVQAQDAATCMLVEGVKLVNPQVGQAAVAAESTGNGQNPVTVTGSDRLNAALTVMQAMESNEIFERFHSVDVTNIYDLRLWYSEDYQFILGNTQDMKVKMAYIKSAMVEILSDYPPGTLDVSDPTNSAGIPFQAFG